MVQNLAIISTIIEPIAVVSYYIAHILLFPTMRMEPKAEVSMLTLKRAFPLVILMRVSKLHSR